jgi:hypothetical protein
MLLKVQMAHFVKIAFDFMKQHKRELDIESAARNMLWSKKGVATKGILVCCGARRGWPQKVF